MRDQKRQSRGGSRRGGQRRGGRFGGNKRGGNRDDRPRTFRKGSDDIEGRPSRGSGRRGGNRDAGDRTGDRTGDRNKKIGRDPNGQRRVSRGNKREDSNKPRDLDSELMNYWVKSGKGQDQEGKNVAQQKLNEDLDNYWKQKEATEKAEQKPAQ